MRWSSFECIQATLLYAGVFDFPLTDTEIHRWLIVPKGQTPPRLTLPVLFRVPHTKDGFYSMEHVVKRTRLRKQRKAISEKKRDIARAVIRRLCVIPTIDLIGISGGLSMNNVSEEDDIDLFFICQPNTIWSTRLYVIFLLSLLGRRRVFGNTYERDLVCPNMFIVHTKLRLPVYERNLYAAHEVLQMEPVYARGDTYFRFIQENEWTAKVLPNAWKWRLKQAQYAKKQSSMTVANIGIFLMKLMNPLSKLVQKIIMHSHITTEVVTDTTFRFHPQDAKPQVMKSFLQSMQQYHIPLDSQKF